MHTGLRQRQVDEGPNGVDMGPGRDLGHDAAESGMLLGLAPQHGRQDLVAGHDRDPGLVTARLDTQDQRRVAHGASGRNVALQPARGLRPARGLPDLERPLPPAIPPTHCEIQIPSVSCNGRQVIGAVVEQIAVAGGEKTGLGMPGPA